MNPKHPEQKGSDLVEHLQIIGILHNLREKTINELVNEASRAFQEALHETEEVRVPFQRREDDRGNYILPSKYLPLVYAVIAHQINHS
jgi:hypothetical protein